METLFSKTIESFPSRWHNEVSIFFFILFICFSGGNHIAGRTRAIDRFAFNNPALVGFPIFHANGHYRFHTFPPSHGQFYFIIFTFILFAIKIRKITSIDKSR